MTSLPLAADSIAVPRGRRRFRRPPWLNGPAIVGLVLIVGWVVVAVSVPLWSPHDPLEPIGRRLMGPGRGHLLGTDAAYAGTRRPP